MTARNGEGQVELVVERLVLAVAEAPARPTRIEGARRLRIRTGVAVREQAIGKAIIALRRVDHELLLDPLPPRQVADREDVAEAMIEDRRGLIDRLVLPVDILVAIIAAIGRTGQRAVIHPILVIRHTVERRVLILLMGIEQRQRGRPVQPELHRWRDAPALIPIMIPARHVIFMIHGVEADRCEIRHAHIAVDRRAIIVGCADAGLDQRFIIALGPLRHNVDIAADRARPAIDGIGAIGDFDLFDVEGVGAAILGAVADAVDADVGVGALAAQVDIIAIAAAAFAGAERDARNGRQDITQGEQVLLLDGLVADDGDRLRHVQKGPHIFGRFRLFDLHFGLVERRVSDGHAAQFGRLLLRMRGACERQRANAAERQERCGRYSLAHGAKSPSVLIEGAAIANRS